MANLSLGGPEVDEAIRLAMKDYQVHKKVLKYAKKSVRYSWFYSKADVEVAREMVESINMDYYEDKLIAAGVVSIKMAIPPSTYRWDKWSKDQRDRYLAEKAAAQARVNTIDKP